MRATPGITRPLIPVALSGLAGALILLLPTSPEAAVPPFLIVLFAIGFASFRLTLKGLCLLALVLSMINTGWRSELLSDHNVNEQLGIPAGWMSLEVQLMEHPVSTQYRGSRSGPKQAEARVLNVIHHEQPQTPAKGRIRLRDNTGFLSKAKAGQILQVEGRYKARVIYPLLGTLDIRGQNQAVLTDQREGKLHAWLARQRSTCAVWLENGLPPEGQSAPILQALLLGMREGVPPSWMDKFAATGTLHIFAISGLHVGLVSILLLFGLRLLGLGQTRWIWPLIPLLILYTLLTGASPSAVRACTMAICFWSALAFHRKPDALSAQSLAALLMVFWQPDQILSLGFIFSFLVVLGLILFATPIYHWLMGDSEFDIEPLQMSALQILQNKTTRWVIASLAVSVTAWVVSAPLTAYTFNRFTPIALMGNMIVAPSVFIILSLGLLSLVFAPWAPGLSSLINQLNAWAVQTLLAGIESLSEIPYAHAYVKAPSLSWVFLFYLLLFTLKFTPRRWWKNVNITLTGILILGAAIRLFSPPALAILPAGEGMCILVDGKSSTDTLIDTGPWRQGWTRVQKLREAGTDSLERIILTHPDAQHYGALPFITEAMTVKSIRTGPLKGSKTYRERLENAQTLGVLNAPLPRHWETVQKDGVFIEHLFPVQEPNSRKGDDSPIVLRISRGRFTVLVLGDASLKAQENMLREGIDPTADVLILSTGSNGMELHPAFLGWTAPNRIILNGSPPREEEWEELVNASRLPWVPTLEVIEEDLLRIPMK